MSKIITVQENVPICEECGGAMKYNQISQKYRCMHCGNAYKVIGHGLTDRELLCEKVVKLNDACKNVII